MNYLIEHAGMLFVAATLLPLLSFVLLILVAALRWGLRPYARQNATVDLVFQFLGGDVTGPGPAYVALGAIALAFVCSASGFVWFLFDEHELEIRNRELTTLTGGAAKGGHDHHEQEEAQQPPKKVATGKKDDKKKTQPPLDEKAKAELAKKEKEAKEAKIAELEKRIHLLENRWEGSFLWARLTPATTKDEDRGTILKVGYRIDHLSAIMFVMVTFVATLIHLFSMGYMKDELQRSVEDHEVHTAHGHLERRGRFGRFFLFLSLFCFSMLNLILADNLFQVFVSWELVGICSYLLIGFYFERTSASNAANKAFITNRVGDAGFVIGLLIIWSYFGTFNFQEIFERLRCPATDAHGVVTKVVKTVVEDDKSRKVVLPEKVAHQILRGTVTEVNGQKVLAIAVLEKDSTGAHRLKLNKTGDHVVIFPRKPHLHDQNADQKVYAQPSARQYSYIPYWMLVAAGLGVFLGCVGKSAQFPLQVWLPDAMEGPTPVSALIHAATMVAAGVYLVGRAYPLFTAEVLLTIAYVGAITLFVAASIAVVMTDIKKVLAYSTVSQLGYMMLALGVGGWSAGLLHLLTHAFFKALLFLGSGSVIYGCHHQQDMLKMGGLYPKMKITAITMLMGVLAISGIPLFSGWYSKDEILVSALGFSMKNQPHFLLFLLPLVTAGITTFYMFRMWFMTFTGTPRDEHVHEHAHESPWMITVPLILLAIFSVGVAWGWPLHDATASWLGHQLHHSQPASVKADFAAELRLLDHNHSIHDAAGALALAMVAVGLAFAAILYFYGVLDPAEAKEQFPGVHRFLLHKWYFDELYSALIVRPGLIVAGWCKNFDVKLIDGFVHSLAWLALFTSRWSGKHDRGVIDGFVNVLADSFYGAGSWLRNIQTGYIRSYILFLALAAMGIWMALAAWARALGN